MNKFVIYDKNKKIFFTTDDGNLNTSNYVYNPNATGVGLPDNLRPLIEISGEFQTNIPTKYWKVSGSNILEMTAEEKTTADGTELNQNQSNLITAVDVITENKIKKGFTWNDKIFSLSPNAQIKWTGLYNAREMISYPLQVRTKDDLEVYNITSSAEVESMYGTIVSTVRTTIDEGSSVKNNIISSSNISEANSYYFNYKNS